ncbi:MAG: FAD/NAD(P)-binding protein [Nitrospirae bacterium]|nr:FAD/NAD(P)-binding protein [Nitrospirota bacterium]
MKTPLFPFKAQIIDIKIETADTKTYTLLSKDAAYTAKPGQFNMVGYPGVGEAPISLSSSVTDGIFQHTIKGVGRVTKFLERFKIGDEIHFRGPYGTHWPLDMQSGNDVLIVAGGVGLAPLRPVIHEIVKMRNFFGKVTVIYGSRSPDNIIFMDEIETWRKDIEVFLTVDEIPLNMKWNYDVGMVTKFIDKSTVNPLNAYAFICGPEIMMLFVSKGLFFRGFLPSRVYVSLERRMKCGIAQCGHCQHGSKFVCKDGPVFAYKEITKLPDGLL